MILYRRTNPAIGKPYGNCPVQAEGVVDGHDFYFRARGDSWSLGIGGEDPVAAPLWYYEEAYGVWPEAGYISDDQAYEFIQEAIKLFRAGVATVIHGAKSSEIVG